MELLGSLLVLLFVILFTKIGMEEIAFLNVRDDEIMVQYCTEKTMVDYASIADIDVTMKGYYQNAANNGNNVGFSLDRQLILNLAAYLHPSTSSAGIRVYPGEDNTNKYVLIKPITADGVEIANFGRIIDVTNLYNRLRRSLSGLV
ncbi:MAG: hypothetical protein IPG18_08770 [Saprospiraceae bacterium]|nr:hypothetical protein [Saprospiraceae bacterium]